MKEATRCQVTLSASRTNGSSLLFILRFSVATGMLLEPTSRVISIVRLPRTHCNSFVVALSAAVLSTLAVAPCWAQSGIGNFGTLGGVEPSGQYPSRQYYLGLEAYRSGDLEQAVEILDSALRSGRRDIRGRWIDSIPALAMLAECHWQLGDLATAREHVDHAMQIAVRNRGWLSRIDWSTALQTGVTRAPPSRLWPEVRNVRLVPIADNMMYQSGQRLTEQALRAGGTIEEPNIRSMDLVEIMRGLAIASYRRRVILGPLAEQDPLADALLEATKYPAGLQVPIGRTLIGAVRATGYLSLHDDERALPRAAENALFNGGVHPLSSIATVSQLYILAGSEEPQNAVPIAVDLVHAAAAARQPEWIGEALQLAAGCATRQQAGTIRDLATRVAAALSRDSRLAAMHAMVAGADAAVTAGDLSAANQLLQQANAMVNRRDVLLPRLTIYAVYVKARLAAEQGIAIGLNETTELDRTLNQISDFALNHRSRRQSLISMPRLYQLALVRRSIGQSLGGASSEKLLKAYSDDPPIELWRRDPVDAISGVITDRSVAHVARVNLNASAGYAEKTLQAIDDLLAARFMQRLPLGGRVAQVRAIAGGDEAILGEQLTDLRQNGPEPLKAVRAAIAGQAPRELPQLQSLEAKACAAALSRVHLPHLVPPRLDEKQPVAEIPARKGLLTFTFVGNSLIGTLSAEGKTVMWTVAGAPRVGSEVTAVLRGIGVGKARGKRLPEDDNWKEVAVRLRRHLIPDELAIDKDRFDSLVIVPDGPLWYLPFELLPLAEADSELFAERMEIRYAPTPGLALKPAALPPDIRDVGVATSLYFAPRDLEQNQVIVDRLLEGIDNVVRLENDSSTPTGLLGGRIGYYVAAAPLAANTNNVLQTVLTTASNVSAYDTLGGWLRFPSKVPRSVVLFGFRTPVGVGKMGNGDEVFATLCGLHVAGVHSVMISRWAVGGESSAIALKELLLELPFTGLNDSWQRARLLLWNSPLVPADEPLLMQSEHDRGDVTGKEPLFWSGYLVSSPGIAEK